MDNREKALEQALIAVLGAAKESGVNTDTLVKKATALIISNSRYRVVEHPNVTIACDEIEKAAKFKK